MKKRMISCIVLLLYVVSLIGVSASAVGINTETEQMTDSTNLNELSVRLVVNAYFTQRLAYLKGEGEGIATANIPMGNDEAKHKAYLDANNITIIDSSVVLDTIECWSNLAFVTATESASFWDDDDTVQETIVHKITVYNDAENTLLLQNDAYIENASGFESCSYISPENAPPAEIQAPQGGTNCIVATATSQIGYYAGSDGYTKYGAWYGQHVYGRPDYAAWEDWCAMFVSWCAHYSSISTIIIPCNWNVPEYRRHFVSPGRYHASRAYGGTYAPKVGDLFFQLGTPDSPGHVGIVSAVTSNAVWVIDGNCQGQVANHQISLTDSSLVAFADPAYVTNNHTASSVWLTDDQYHWHPCAYCGFGELNKGAHVMDWDTSLYKVCCTVCSLEYTEGMHHVVEPKEE